MADLVYCPKHPRRAVGKDGCWDCLGRPPGWRCTAADCGKPLPCRHVRDAPALTKAAADASCELREAVDLYKAGACGWSQVEEGIQKLIRAERDAWREYLDKKRTN